MMGGGGAAAKEKIVSQLAEEQRVGEEISG